MLVSEHIADYCEKPESALKVSTALVNDFLNAEQQKLDSLFNNSGKASAVELRKRMETVLTQKVGLFRNGTDLEQAVTELQELLQQSSQIKVSSSSPGANPELVLAYRLPRMLKIAIGVALGAR
ncbi:MAG: fumarate reductase flavoprotein subunit, partial [Candidatus Sedimenticola sp. 6PFRAG5]